MCSILYAFGWKIAFALLYCSSGHSNTWIFRWVKIGPSHDLLTHLPFVFLRSTTIIVIDLILACHKKAKSKLNQLHLENQVLARPKDPSRAKIDRFRSANDILFWTDYLFLANACIHKILFPLYTIGVRQNCLFLISWLKKLSKTLELLGVPERTFTLKIQAFQLFSRNFHPARFS